MLARQRSACVGAVSRDDARVTPALLLATTLLSAAPAPPIVRDLIPFPAQRKRETAAYARRHYGVDTHLLLRPRVIVEHVALAPSAAAVRATFAVDRPDPELRELPQVCAHFVVDRDGTIHQLVSLRLMCRHTVGLNDVAIGIEHAGFSDGGVLSNRRQLAASIRLTTWLRCRYDIGVGNVIGHGESLSSPYHHERVAALRRQTHGDMRRASMAVYRKRLAQHRCGDTPARWARKPVRETRLRAQRRAEVLGRSVRGRPIRAVVVGDPASARSIAVVGCIHGTERAGIAVTRALRGATPPPGVALWLVDAFNPDGCAAGTRQNANGVDLNRNARWHWRPLDRPGGTYWSGPRPLSEPESRAIRNFVRARRPAVTIWYHQHAALVDDSGGDRAIERAYARLAGLPLRDYGPIPGKITGWQNAAFPSATAFVVELPAGPLSQPSLRRHVRAVLAVARTVGQSG